jgi:hypothetical protein
MTSSSQRINDMVRRIVEIGGEEHLGDFYSACLIAAAIAAVASGSPPAERNASFDKAPSILRQSADNYAAHARRATN